MWVPPSVGRDLLDERLRQEQELLAQVQIHAVCEEWNPQLRRIDHNLELIFAPDQADAVGLVPGRWHLMRRNDLGPPDLWPLNEGEEPGSRMLDMLSEGDMWSNRSMNERKRAQRELERAREHAKAREREERRDEIRERIDSANRLSVSFSPRG